MQLWIAYGMSGVAILFLLMDGVMKALQMAPAMKATTELGYPARVVIWIGVIELASLALYAIPSTSLLGAVLLTGYLGGAVATNVRVESPWLTHTLFPVYVAILIWGGLLLRDERLRALVSLRG